MDDTRSDRHRETVVEQFTAQAAGYAQAEPIRNEQALGLLLEACAPSGADRVLDVACGTGVVTCALAQMASEVTGIDVTPAMIDHARELARERGLRNLIWHVAAIPPLPFEDASFDLVVSRYAFHHFVDPPAVLRRLAGELESLLARSAPAAGGADEVRRRFVASLRDDSLGVKPWRDGERIRYSFPIAIVVGERETVH